MDSRGGLTLTPIANILRRFDSTLVEPDIPAEEPPSFASPGPQLDALIAIARADGQKQGRQQATGDYQAELERERQCFDKRLNEARLQWIQECQEHIAGQFTRAIEDLCDEIRVQMAVCLRPFLASNFEQKAVAEAIQCVRRLLKDRSGAVIRVVGPPRLIDQISLLTLNLPCTVECEETCDADLKISIDTTIVETKTREWIASLGLDERSAAND